MAKQSSVNLDITNNADGFDISGGTTVRKLGITGGDITIAGSGSAVVTFPNTSTTIAGLGITQSFSALQSFSAGISAAGGVTLAGTLRGTTSSFTAGVFTGTFSGATGSFSKLLTASAGLSVAGGVTFASDIRVNSITVGAGAGGFNTAVGYEVLRDNTVGSSNVAVGYNALVANSTGTSNQAVGYSALGNNISGNLNVGIGHQALGGITQGDANIAIGYRAGLYTRTGSILRSATDGIFIGYNTRGSTSGQTNEIVIGRDAVGLGSNTTVLGVTTAVSATIYGLVNAPSGISAAGATFSGNVSVVGTIAGNQGLNTQTGTSYTLALTDLRKLITLNNAAAVTLTLPTFASVGFTGGASVDIVQLGVGVVGVTGAAGVTVRSTPGLFLRTQYSTASCIKIETNEWLITGDLSS